MTVTIPVSEDKFKQIQERYAIERKKRVLLNAVAQYDDIANSTKFSRLADNPWTETEHSYTPDNAPIHNNGHCKVVIVGTGYGGLLFAVRFILEAGFKPEDVVFIDTAGGFGGTWYWNRYPGLMCDIESACYMPLLEETGYIPKHRYGYGPELREHAEMIARKWQLHNRALFYSTAQKAAWDEESSMWRLTIERQEPNKTVRTMEITSDNVVLASGIINRPKMPSIPGLELYKGHLFHTSRWDYKYTGGTPENPILDKLKGKKVAFIGTGPTGIQAIPQLAKYAGHLYVFQRTPSAVAVRDQREIDPDQFRREVANGPGWQAERRDNLTAFLSNLEKLPEKNLVNDGWTEAPTVCALSGTPKMAEVTEENLDEFVEALHRLDLPRQEKIRARVDAVVQSPIIASQLKPWYASWCKRPCFHDDYLETFNLPNVELVDTLGRGVDGFSPIGPMFNNREFDADLTILGTGFEPFVVGSPAFRAGMVITGRDGLSMDDKWAASVGTLHGLMARGFPNLFLAGNLAQASASWNNVHSMDIMAKQSAYILTAAKAKICPNNDQSKIVIEPTLEAEENWSKQVAAGAPGFGAIGRCLPSYYNADLSASSDVEARAKKLKQVKGVSWAKGLLDFGDTLKAWQTSNGLQDLEISVSAYSHT